MENNTLLRLCYFGIFLGGIIAAFSTYGVNIVKDKIEKQKVRKTDIPIIKTNIDNSIKVKKANSIQIDKSNNKQQNKIENSGNLNIGQQGGVIQQNTYNQSYNYINEKSARQIDDKDIQEIKAIPLSYVVELEYLTAKVETRAFANQIIEKIKELGYIIYITQGGMMSFEPDIPGKFEIKMDENTKTAFITIYNQK